MLLPWRGESYWCRLSLSTHPAIFLSDFLAGFVQGIQEPWEVEERDTRCGEEGNRTPDLLLAKQALYQLSYSPEPFRQQCARTWIRTRDLSFIRAAL
jgi:hypothetical protein